MPYFKRYPFSEIPKAPPMAPTLESVDIVDAARDVLAQEGPRQAAEGPFRLRSVLRPGETGQIILGVSADADGSATRLRLVPGDLVSTSGRIAAAQLNIEPASLVLGPGTSRDVAVAITAPLDLPAGRYVGPLTALGDDGFVVTLEVVVQR